MFVGATALTAINDNALITDLTTLVPNLGDELKLAVVQGAVVGGGLTVITALGRRPRRFVVFAMERDADVGLEQVLSAPDVNFDRSRSQHTVSRPSGHAHAVPIIRSGNLSIDYAQRVIAIS